MTVRHIPSHVKVIVIGAGFAGASTAAALARDGVTSGLILEREPLPGTHASGRNAAIARQLESDPTLLKLAIEGVRRLRTTQIADWPVLNEVGGVYLFHGPGDRAAEGLALLRQHCVPVELLSSDEARRRYCFLNGFQFDHALFCPTDGVMDIHALLTGMLKEARNGGFELVTDCTVDSLILEGDAVRGVRTSCGDVAAPLVIDAAGAWAGHLGRPSAPLPLRPLRRHLFVSDHAGEIPREAPFVWDLDIGYYVRPEGTGLLLCPCDESEHAPGVPAVDPEAADLLASKLLDYAPGLADIALRRNWACLRTFAPDRLPVIGWDPNVTGLFHVSALGGFGATTSLAVGGLAAALIGGRAVDWVDAASFSAGRFARG